MTVYDRQEIVPSPKGLIVGVRWQLLANSMNYERAPRVATALSLLSHLYPLPRGVVVGLISAMSDEARFAPRMAGFYSPSWI